MCAFCLEYGVAIRQGAGVFKIDLPRVIADESNDLTPTMRRFLVELFEVGEADRMVTREIEGLPARDEAARRLVTIPGIGPRYSAACSRRQGSAV
jgi:transposase